MTVIYDFHGKSAVVTGGAKGIGKAIATAFAEAGANVVIADFNEEAGRKTVQELSEHDGKILFCKTDVSSAASVNEMRDTALAELGQIDILVNNAGIGTKHPGPPFIEIPEEEFGKLFNVNTMGVVHTCQAFYGQFAARKSGKIINVASIAGIEPSPIMPQYCMSKAAIIILSECLAKEMGSFNVNVNVVNPGFVFTDIYAEGGDQACAQLLKKKLPHILGDLESSEDIVKRMGANSNMRRMQTPEDMANAVLFLASEAAKNISGQCINVDSGIIYR